MPRTCSSRLSVQALVRCRTVRSRTERIVRGQEPCLSVVTRSGSKPLTALAERKDAWVAALSRAWPSRVSIRFPSWSIAR